MNTLLILFDVDGTLFSTPIPGGMNSKLTAIEEVWDLTLPEGFAPDFPAGSTDRQQLHTALRELGLDGDVTPQKLHAWEREVGHQEAVQMPADLTSYVSPGIGLVLDALATQGHRLALLTGNVAVNAHLKVARGGIGEFFDPRIGAYGDDAEQRNELPLIARTRAGALSGQPWPREHTLIVGDSVRDVACAQADRLDSAVVTDITTEAQALEEAGATYLLTGGTLAQLVDVAATIA